MQDKLYELLHALNTIYSGWILWNLFLAIIPLVLSFWLFRRKTPERLPIWWILLAIYIAFLPNAPYLLTDIVHLIRGIRVGYSAAVISLIFVPLHFCAILIGFEAYVIALINQGHYLKRIGLRQYVLWSELVTHFLCAIGIFLGRFRRYNSWDLVSDPRDLLYQTLDDLTSKLPLLIIVVTFIILTVLYWVMKQVTLGLILRIRYARMGKDVD
ncbi:DUF1361 domain-containing protein [Leptothermofonsia sichuanensis E412]|uniref:DUF1361 domain-containing protein n=1 Tax=Leptothermofonsia sichuanensis TaxID=2917832 RepID=UPI001CA70737|nr:DUF1361 domain-containing protein [Leptothermofonsia sichuanensis]QZZ22728.1 DUF1361 domain-containing protein [Leptothermofonsia sichuanensis E412]